MGGAWTGPNWCRNGRESGVRVQARGKPLDGTRARLERADEVPGTTGTRLEIISSIYSRVYIVACIIIVYFYINTDVDDLGYA